MHTRRILCPCCTFYTYYCDVPAPAQVRWTNPFSVVVLVYCLTLLCRSTSYTLPPSTARHSLSRTPGAPTRLLPIFLFVHFVWLVSSLCHSGLCPFSGLEGTFDLKWPKLNVLLRDKFSFVGVAHLTRGDRSCLWALCRF